MGDWTEEVWIRRNNPGPADKSILSLDSAKCHLTAYAKNAVGSTAHMAVIPARMTKVLQVLDVSVNKVFKDNLRKKWEQFMIDKAKHTFTKSGNMKRASYAEVCRWIVESWDEVRPETIIKGFKKVFDENIEDLVRMGLEPEAEEDNDDEPHMNDLLALSEEDREAFDEPHFISDEEFDGFDE